MSLRERCNIDDHSFSVSARGVRADGFRYRWVALNKATQTEPGYMNGSYDESLPRPGKNYVLEIVEDPESAIIVPDEVCFKLNVVIKQSGNYTLMTFADSMGIHLSRIHLKDNNGTTFLLGNGTIQSGTAWYLPADIKMGKGKGDWSLVKDAYCDNALTISYQQ